MSIKRLEKLNASMITLTKLGQRIGNQCNQAACACGLAIRESKRTLGTMAPYPGMIDNDRQARAEPRDGMAWGDLKRNTKLPEKQRVIWTSDLACVRVPSSIPKSSASVGTLK